MTANLKYSASPVVLALAAGLTVSSAAVAADMPVKALKPVAPAVVNWEGIYLGGHLGWGRATHSGSYRDPDSVVFADALKLNGFLGGFQAGYNWDRGNWVWGIEGDWSFMRWKRTAIGISSETLLGDINQLASIRARIGIPVGNARSGLAYLTGGLAWTDAKVTVFDGVQGSPFTNSQTLRFNRIGAVVGGGLEWVLTNQIRARAEALYYIFNDSQLISAALDPVPGDHVRLKNILTVRVGLNWYFNSPR